jgi:hypothetical protein
MNDVQFANTIEHLRLRHGVSMRAGQTLGEQCKHLLESIGDFATWNSQMLKDFVAYAVTRGFVTSEQLEALHAKHGFEEGSVSL